MLNWDLKKGKPMYIEKLLIMEKYKNLSINKQKYVLLDIDYTIFDTAVYKESQLVTYSVYEEVLPTLTTLADIAHVGIFSEGDLGLQQKKLRKTNIEEFFIKEHIYIVEKKHKAVEKILERYRDLGKLYLVDDKLPILYIAKKFMPTVTTIWVKRGVYALNQDPIIDFSPDAVVDNLQEIIPLIAK
jgi:FMN phosphatase YigB (HAD superfamily)